MAGINFNFKHLYYFWRVAKTGGVARAGEELHLTPQTISGQIQLLEDYFRAPLFARRGRSLELTEAGRLALEYAEQMFSLGAELEESIRERPQGGRAIEFRVGVADAVPRSIASRLLAPATRIPEPVRIVCRGWKLDSLLAELAAHRLDLVLSDAPIPPSVSVRAYSHPLGRSGTSFFAASGLLRQHKGKFPGCLEGAPLLLPGEDTALRPRLERWRNANKLRFRAAGEFDDTALMKAFGALGLGIFPGPSVLEAEIEAQYGVKALGRAPEIFEEFFAISVQRRVTHPCVAAMATAAREELFA